MPASGGGRELRRAELAGERVQHAIGHARLLAVAIPPELKDRVFLAADLPGAKPIIANSAAAGFQSSDYPALARDKVRFVGEMIAICIGRTRAEAEDAAPLPPPPPPEAI